MLYPAVAAVVLLSVACAAGFGVNARRDRQRLRRLQVLNGVRSAWASDAEVAFALRDWVHTARSTSTVLLGNLSLITRSALTESSQRQLSQAQSAGERLQHHIEGLVESVKPSLTGSEQVKAVDPVGLVRRICETLALRRVADVTVSGELSSSYEVDEPRLAALVTWAIIEVSLTSRALAIDITVAEVESATRVQPLPKMASTQLIIRISGSRREATILTQQQQLLVDDASPVRQRRHPQSVPLALTGGLPGTSIAATLEPTSDGGNVVVIRSEVDGPRSSVARSGS